MTVKQNDTTKVIFRMWRGDVIALFPEVPASNDGFDCLSYQHIGQHSGADPLHIIRNSRAATEVEYAELKRELEVHYGYVFDIRKRMTADMYRERQAELKRMTV